MSLRGAALGPARSLGTWSLLLSSWLLIGCSSAKRRAEVASAVPRVEAAGAGRGEHTVGSAEIEDTGAVAEAEPGERGTSPVWTATACIEVARLAVAGEHKPAVDLFDELDEAGIDCPQAVEDAERSRAQWRSADELLLAAREAEQAGDLDAALLRMNRALEIYPRYHWAARLKRDLEARIPATAGSPPSASLVAAEEPENGALSGAKSAANRLHLAQAAEALGRLEQAARLLLRGLRLLDEAVPEDASAAFSDSIEYATRLGLKLFSEGRLTLAQEVWGRALALDPANGRLGRYLDEVSERLEMLERIKAESGGEARPRSDSDDATPPIL